VYPGVDLARFAPDPAARDALRSELGLDGDLPLLAFLGSDYRRKGLSTLLAALARIPEAHALVIGAERPERLAVFRDEASRAGIGTRVHWLGVQPDPQRPLAAADLLVFPTHFDAFGSAVLEALACGVPVLVSGNAGAAELVTPGETGAVLDPSDEAAVWADAAKPFLVSERRSALRAAARAAAETHPWSRHLRRVLQVYQELAENPLGE
jgi:UDP-glucose:(heptosyl)LPS alpha-1,3-glucosyltransferase